MARGIGGGLEKLGAGIAAYKVKRKADADEAERLRKALGYLDPERADEYKAASLPQLRGKVDSLAMKRARDIQEREAAQEKRAAQEEGWMREVAGPEMPPLPPGLETRDTGLEGMLNRIPEATRRFPGGGNQDRLMMLLQAHDALKRGRAGVERRSGG